MNKSQILVCRVWVRGRLKDTYRVTSHCVIFDKVSVLYEVSNHCNFIGVDNVSFDFTVYDEVDNVTTDDNIIRVAKEHKRRAPKTYVEYVVYNVPGGYILDQYCKLVPVPKYQQ